MKLCQYIFGYAVVRLENIACYSKDRISASVLTADTYVGVDNLLQNRGGKKLSEHIPTEGNVVGFMSGDTLIGNIRPYLKKIWLANCDGGTNGDVLVVRGMDKTIICPQFLYHILASDDFFHFNNYHAKGVKMPRGNKDAIMLYQFAVPSLERQKEIVSILDRFEGLCKDISAGLSSEIIARQKQYEYYCDKLLSFAER